jgi:hypothetical protein
VLLVGRQARDALGGERRGDGAQRAARRVRSIFEVDRKEVSGVMRHAARSVLFGPLIVLVSAAFILLFRGSQVPKKPTPAPTGTIRAADLEAERQAIPDDLGDFKIYPVLTLGVSCRFCA